MAVPASPLDTAPELEHKIRDSGAKVVFFLDLLYDRVEPSARLWRRSKAFVAGRSHRLPAVRQAAALPAAQEAKLAPKQPDFDARTADRALPRFRDGRLAALPLSDPVRRSGSDLAVILYTGGTTGVSKGVMLSHRALVVNQAMAQAWIERRAERRVSRRAALLSRLWAERGAEPLAGERNDPRPSSALRSRTRC